MFLKIIRNDLKNKDKNFSKNINNKCRQKT